MSMACRATRAAPTSVPGSMVPVSSMVTWHWIGSRTPARFIARRAPLMAALACRRSKTVSMTRRSAPALDQRVGLLLVGVAQVGVPDLAERRELGARADAARHPARLVRRREVVRGPAGDGHGGQVQLAHAVAQAVLGQDGPEGAEGVGLDHVAADLVEGAVDLVDGVGTGHHQQLVAALQVRPTEVVGRELLQLQVRPHGAVEDDDALACGLEIARFGALDGHSPPTIVGGRRFPACRRAGTGPGGSWRPSDGVRLASAR